MSSCVDCSYGADTPLQLSGKQVVKAFLHVSSGRGDPWEEWDAVTASSMWARGDILPKDFFQHRPSTSEQLGQSSFSSASTISLPTQSDNLCDILASPTQFYILPLPTVPIAHSEAQEASQHFVDRSTSVPSFSFGLIGSACLDTMVRPAPASSLPLSARTDKLCNTLASTTELFVPPSPTVPIAQFETDKPEETDSINMDSFWSLCDNFAAHCSDGVAYSMDMMSDVSPACSCSHAGHDDDVDETTGIGCIEMDDI